MAEVENTLTMEDIDKMFQEEISEGKAIPENLLKNSRSRKTNLKQLSEKKNRSRKNEEKPKIPQKT